MSHAYTLVLIYGLRILLDALQSLLWFSDHRYRQSECRALTPVCVKSCCLIRVTGCICWIREQNTVLPHTTPFSRVTAAIMSRFVNVDVGFYKLTSLELPNFIVPNASVGSCLRCSFSWSCPSPSSLFLPYCWALTTRGDKINEGAFCHHDDLNNIVGLTGYTE